MLEIALHHKFAANHDQPDLDLTFTAPPGLTVLYGASGSGKTSVINAVAGLLRPDRGRIAVKGVALCDTDQGIWQPAHQRGLGYVFQEARLFPHLTVRQNLKYGAWFARGCPAGPGFDQVVDMLGIGPLLDRRPGALSGGEKQRVAIGRALLARPRLLLADEPLAALDPARKAEILPYFERLRDEGVLPILYVCHAPEEVARLATTVVALDQGRVQHIGPAEEVLANPDFTPQGPRAVGALLQASIVRHHDDGLSELVVGGQPFFVPQLAQAPGHRLRLRIAAQDVILARSVPRDISALNVLSGAVEEIRPGKGPQSKGSAIIAIRTPAGRVLARITQRSLKAMGLEQGQPLHAIVKTVAIAPQDIGA
ncbi:molybdenum ABC transporter ATP-binding protein [Aliiroseovarius crassostreae]|uniref:molybdenum ABC transporter ATP-binding protein n=1 Tax=Aliiroseovarius crassostreae TaxID=154981 RepID=UPI003C7AA849